MANGRIAEYEVYVSDRPSEWGDPVVTGKWENNTQWQTALFEQPQMGRYVRLWIKSEVNRRPYASAAEIELVVP